VTNCPRAAVLLMVFLACALGARLSYGEARKAAYYPAAMCALGALCAGLFALGARRLGGREVYSFSLAFDCVVAAAYYLLPALWGVRVGWGAAAGVVLVLAGLAVVKASN
jgi:hypothetical protein